MNYVLIQEIAVPVLCSTLDVVSVGEMPLGLKTLLIDWSVVT